MLPTSDRFSTMVNRMDEEMEELLNWFSGRNEAWLTTNGAFVPNVDVVESENQLEVTVDLPGLKPEEVHVELKNGDLWISGKREEEKEEKGKTCHRIERRHGEFQRVLTLPGAIKEEEIAARFENGVLKIAVPKTEEAKARQIEVKA